MWSPGRDGYAVVDAVVHGIVVVRRGGDRCTRSVWCEARREAVLPHGNSRPVLCRVVSFAFGVCCGYRCVRPIVPKGLTVLAILNGSL